jgi:hypothetical protein
MISPAHESPEMVDARDTVTAGGIVIATALAGMYWAMRTGFANPPAPILQALGLVLFLLATPALIRRQYRSATRWWKSEPAITIALIALTLLPGMLADESARILGPAVAVAGFLGAVLVLARWLRQGSVVSSLLFAAGSAVFGVWGGGVMWATRYKMPLFWETLSFRSNVHHDPLYMTAIGNMLDVYGVPSTGFDGVPQARYHFGSSWLLTQWAELTGTDALSFYSLGYAVVIFPLFFAAMFLLAVELRKAFFGDVSWRPLRTDWMLFAAFAVAVIGFIPNDAMDALAVWNGHAMLSESYLVGMVFFLLAIGVVVSFWQGSAKESFNSAALFFVVFAPFAVVVSGLLKVSLMVLLLAAMLYLALRLGLWRRMPVVAGAVISIILAAFTYSIVVLPEHNTGISPLNFMRYQVESGWQQFFPLAHLLLTWVYVAGRLWEERIGDWSALGEAIRGRRIVDAEVVLGIALLGFIPGEVISIHGGSAVYFSDVQRWLALSFILARLGTWVGEFRLRRAARNAGRPVVSGWRGVRLSWLFAVVVGGPFVATVAYNAMQWPLRAMRSNVTLRRELVAIARGDSSAAATAGRADILNPALLASGLEKAAYYPIVTALRRIAALPSSDRERTLLFIPQSYAAYWSMLTDDGRCVFTPLVAPAVSSIALLDGMPAAGCEMTDQYNMSVYTPRSAPQSVAETTDEAICARAKAKGFSRVIHLGGDSPRRPEIRRIECAGQANNSAGGGKS